jgi:outer membrane protein assembly factor BamB
MNAKTVLAMLLSSLALVLTALPSPSPAADAPASTPERIGVSRGICVLLEDRECRTALDFARSTELTLWVQLGREEDVEPARRAAEAAGLLGSRIYVERGSAGRIGLADDLADAVVAAGPAAAPPEAEVLRVLRPEGVGVLGERTVRKPWPQGVDDWSHHYHGPDNNPQSADRLARAPFLTQFVAEPRYATAPQAAVASSGRLFMAFGNVAWHEREEPVLNTLFAVNAFNGTLLWKRPLPQGIMVDRSTLIATPRLFYLGGRTSCLLLDAATGREVGDIKVPAELTDGPFWKWMAIQDGRLFALVGKDEPPDDDERWRSQNHGWPWDGISKGYNKKVFDWGFAPTLFALHPESGKVLWHHREEAPIDARGTCMKDGRIYITRFGEYLACLEAATGKEVWRRTAARDPEVFKEIGPYRPGHGYVEGWKSTVYLKSAGKALYIVGPQVNWLTALSAEDGRFLWKYPGKDLHIVIRDDGVYTIGPERSQGHTHRLDPLTGQVLATFPVSRRACTRSTGSADGIFFRASEGSTRLDLAAGLPQWISPMRPSCHVGVVVAGGHLYWTPWACDCDLQLFGVISCSPAGSFRFGQEAREEDRLEAPGLSAAPADFPASSLDWPQYRADAARSARTGATVPENPALLWRQAPKAPCEATAPVAAGGLVFLGGSDGGVRALDAATGAPRWTALTGGAIRYPPAIYGGKAFVGSSDGRLHAFEAATGRLLWRFRGAPEERWISLHGRLISTWPVASAPVADGGTVYLAAGLTSADGTHVYALDAATGKIRWQNNDSGHLDRFSRRGIAAQGDTLLHEGRLYLAGGNAVSPGVYDAASGKCLIEPPTQPGSVAPRGRELRLTPEGVRVSGQPLYSISSSPVFDGSTRWDRMVVTAANARLVLEERKAEGSRTWTLVARRPGEGGELWARPLPGEPARWGIAVDAKGRIAVSFLDGQILCFGATETAAAWGR